MPFLFKRVDVKPAEYLRRFLLHLAYPSVLRLFRFCQPVENLIARFSHHMEKRNRLHHSCFYKIYNPLKLSEIYSLGRKLVVSLYRLCKLFYSLIALKRKGAVSVPYRGFYNLNRAPHLVKLIYIHFVHRFIRKLRNLKQIGGIDIAPQELSRYCKFLLCVQKHREQLFISYLSLYRQKLAPFHIRRKPFNNVAGICVNRPFAA